MKILKFECTALSDLVLSETPGSLQQTTLGFIPGSALRGIAANSYADFGAGTDAVFHSGQVRFGNAYPLVKGSVAMPMPGSFFAHATDKAAIRNYATTTRSAGYKRAKEEFIAGDYRFTPNRRQALKTAIDRNLGTAQEGQLFLYEALPMGMAFHFEVSLQDAAEGVADKIKQALEGVRRVGRSKGAEFGKVDIRFKEAAQESGVCTGDSKDVVIFLQADLCLPGSEFSVPEINPPLFGLDDNWKIDAAKSFISWGQIAFFNSKKNTRSSARRVVKRGSVIRFITHDQQARAWQIQSHIGAHTEEGFGAVVVNPKFLEKAELRLNDVGDTHGVGTDAIRFSSPTESTAFLAALKRVRPTVASGRDDDNKVKAAASEVRKALKHVARQPSSSQWNNIREMAVRATSKDAFFSALDDALKKGNLQKTFAQESGLKALGQIVEEQLRGLDHYPADVVQFCRLVQGGDHG